MSIKHSYWIMILFFGVFISWSQILYAQCAGSNAEVAVCNKDNNGTNQNFNLFNQLEGTPTLGGTWTANDSENSSAIVNAAFGIVNLWNIRKSGAHVFTYTCGGATATVTVNLGGYPGDNVATTTVNACQDNSAVNLFDFLAGNASGKLPDLNGTWSLSGGFGGLSQHLYDATANPPGTYTFIYTTPAINNSGGTQVCAARTATITLETKTPAKVGTPSNQTFCISDDVSALTSFNLHDLLTDEDLGGVWTENSGTTEISGAADTEINITNLKAMGVGEYSFTYTVTPSLICDPKSVEVKIIFVPKLQGTISIPDFCSGNSIEATLNYDNTLLPDADYRIEYKIADSSGTLNTETKTISCTGGTASFSISTTNIVFNTNLEFSVLSFEGAVPVQVVCNAISIPVESFIGIDPTVLVGDSCVNNSNTVDLNNILQNSGGVKLNGTHDVNMLLTSPSGGTNNFTFDASNFASGATSLLIPQAALNELGLYNIVLSIPSAYTANCSFEQSFTVNDIPSQIQLQIDSILGCSPSSIGLQANAPLITTGLYTITHSVRATGTSIDLITNSITTSGGNLNFDLDVSSLQGGNYEIIFKSTQNDTTPCRTITDFEVRENFSISNSLDPPVVNNTTPSFCAALANGEPPAIEDIEIISNQNVDWFAEETSTTPLEISTLLENGEDYFVANAASGSCESSTRVRVVVSILPMGTLSSDNLSPEFCQGKEVRLQDIEVNASANSTVVWFDKVNSGNLLSPSTLIEGGEVYIARALHTNGCISSSFLEFSPKFKEEEGISIQSTHLATCTENDPTVQLLDNLFLSLPNGVEVTWYNSATGGTPLMRSTRLSQNTYYAEINGTDDACIVSGKRRMFTVDLEDCNLAGKDFFIPDGFTPNNDGKNDYFYAPNIEFVHPDFTITIYNRYGAVLFTGDKSNPKWDGTANGNQIVPTGFYFYVIQFNTPGQKHVQGKLFLSR